MDDSSLLRAFVQEHAESAFEQLVARYLPLVQSAALRRTGGDPHRAGEVTQMVFSELARKAARLVDHPALAAWLHQSTRWHASTLRRAERRRARHEAAAAAHIAALGEPDPTPAWEELAPVLDAALDTLREADRDAVLQRFFMDRPFAEIGRRLGVSENAARMRVERAVDGLRTVLARHGLSSTAAALALALAQNANAALPGAATASTIAATACQAAGGGVATGAASLCLLMKATLATTAAVAAALGFALWRQGQDNDRLALELAALNAPVPSTTPHTSVAPKPECAPAIEDKILAEAEYVAPLTAEQKERVRLDTIVRKGDLDRDYAMLFRLLRLPPETLDAFRTLLVERNQAIYDAMQLAKDQGLEFTSLADERLLADSVVGEFDGRIAALLGNGGLAQLREYLELEPFRHPAEVLRQGAASRYDLADDERVLQLARTLQQVAPDFPERLYQSNGWGVDEPPAMRAAIVAALGTPPPAATPSAEGLVSVERRMAEIAREAVLAGTIPIGRVSGMVAREYKAALARHDGGARQ